MLLQVISYLQICQFNIQTETYYPQLAVTWTLDSLSQKQW